MPAGNPINVSFTNATPTPPTVEDQVLSECAKLQAGISQAALGFVLARAISRARLFRLKLSNISQANQPVDFTRPATITPGLMAQGMGNKLATLLQIDTLVVKFIKDLEAVTAATDAPFIVPDEYTAGVPDNLILTLDANGDGGGTITTKPVVFSKQA